MAIHESMVPSELHGADPGIPLVTSVLDDADIAVRGDAFAALVSNENDIAHVLTGCLGSPSSNVRACAILILANRGDCRDIDRILLLEGDPSPAVRECVAGAIGYLGARDRQDVLVRLLADAHIGVRKGAARALLALRCATGLSGVMGGDAEMDSLLRELGVVCGDPKA
ncbi:MAG: HEAT repeat domain-containing protein [Nitrosopumilus sp. D6]|nr:MAG: HEAT repeat domain-containing protein [Nitrosopumilus sp. D6]